MKELIKKYWKDILAAVLLTFVVMIPYLFQDLLYIGHDTFFHVSRIEQLSISISEGSFFPAVYPYENNGFGYASPLFYCDFLLILPALIHLAGVSISISYKITVIGATFFSCLSMILLVKHISKSQFAGWIAGAAYLFSNYHISDIYVRGALGELFAFIFLPIVILGMYKILIDDDTHWGTLTFGLAGLAVSHNLTFLMGSLLCAIFFVIEIRHMTKKKFFSLFKGILFAFLITAWYTIPMEEQIHSQSLVVNYYSSSYDLGTGSMNLYQYFVNETVFGYSGNTLEHSRMMTVNVGWFLTFAPLLWIFVKKEIKQKYPFVTKILILGYICFLLPSSLIPWGSLSFLGVLQFPWRINTMTIVLLSIPAAMSIVNLVHEKAVHICVLCVLSLECVYHIVPVFSRTFGITSDMTWSDVTNGAICDPYYSANFMRVEIAAGDYLPTNHPDFRERSTAIKDTAGNDIITEYTKTGTTLSFSVSDTYASQEIVLPITWYKGYTVYQEVDGTLKEIFSYRNSEGMVAFYSQGSGTYYCMYQDTWIRRIMIYDSWASLAVLLFLQLRKHKTKTK